MKKYPKLIKTNVKKIKINIYDLELQKNNFRKFKQKNIKKSKKKNKTKHSKLLYSVMMLP